MVNSLDIAPDDIDDVGEVLNDAFGLAPSDWPRQRFETMGELEAWLSEQLSDVADRHGACMTTLAFLRLRAALDVDFRVKPSTRLATLAGRNPRRFQRDLSAATGLALPSTAVTRRGSILAFALFLGLPAFLIAGQFAPSPYWLPAALLSWPLMIAVLWLDPNRVPREWATLGQLARLAVPLNYRRLAESGAAARPDGLWDALVALLSQEVELPLPASAINRDTRLFATVH